MKALIFGTNGQDGFYLKKLLARENVETTGVSRGQSELVDVPGDVANFEFVEKTIKDLQPAYVFHLAASSTTRHDRIFDNHLAIATGTINILESVKRHCSSARVFLSGSAVQFQNTGAPIDENTDFAALSPYAVSRIESVYWGRYFRAQNLKVYAGYFFNHDSPRRTDAHVNQKIAAAVRRINAGSIEKLELGDISVKKEFGFAGDAVAAVWTLVNQTNVFEAVIGTGAAHSIEDWLELCFSRVNKNWRDYVIIKNDYKAEYQILVSNPRLIKSLGWQPATTIQELARMMIEE